MDLFLCTTRCRIPPQLLVHQYRGRRYATAFASRDRPPHPTAHKHNRHAVESFSRAGMSQKRSLTASSASPSAVSSPAASGSASASASRPISSPTSQSTTRLSDPSRMRKARVAQALKEREEAAEKGVLDSAQMLKEIEMVSAVEQFAAFDVWAKAINNMDLYIPAWRDPRKGATIVDHLRVIWNTQVNWVKNILNMRTIAQANGFPAVPTRRVYSPQLFRIQSTSWLAPFRKTALETYLAIQRAVASGDEKTLKKYTIGTQQKRVLELVRARDPSKVYLWSSDAPAQNEARVVSIRAFEQNMGRDEPKFGNRLTVQALVRFTTVQKLEVYTKRGQVVQSADPKRVVEYLIFQKRMWYDAPWVIRDQLYEGLQGKTTHM